MKTWGHADHCICMWSLPAGRAIKCSTDSWSGCSGEDLLRSRGLKGPAQHGMCLQNKAAAGATKQVSGAGQTWAAPNNLTQLMDVLKAPNKVSGQGQLRIIAGNTGSGPTLCFLGSCNAHNAVFAHNECPLRHGGSALCIRGMSGL